MKKSIIIAIAAGLVFGLASTSFAHRYDRSSGASNVTIEGKVISVNQAKGNFVLACNELGKNTTVYTSQDQISSLHAGDFIKVTLPPGGHMAQKIVKR